MQNSSRAIRATDDIYTAKTSIAIINNKMKLFMPTLRLKMKYTLLLAFTSTAYAMILVILLLFW